MKTFNTIIMVCAIAITGTVNFHLGKYYEKKDNHPDHSLCAKAIELKVEETDSLELELALVKDDLRQCEDLYRELNNKKN